MPPKSDITAVVPCRQCATRILAIAEICPHCGVRQDPGTVARPIEASDKMLLPAGVLCVLLGVFGGHRFYVGKVGTGLLMLCTLGGLGLWMLYDLVLILTGQFRDADGKPLTEFL
jgi:hypothetical protein